MAVDVGRGLSFETHVAMGINLNALRVNEANGTSDGTWLVLERLDAKLCRHALSQRAESLKDKEVATNCRGPEGVVNRQEQVL